jgi:hypothetical protein
MVVRQILVLFVLVRIQVGQQKRYNLCRFFLLPDYFQPFHKNNSFYSFLSWSFVGINNHEYRSEAAVCETIFNLPALKGFTAKPWMKVSAV